MDPILAGTETEYGLLIDGRGVEDQIEDAMALVRGYPGGRLSFKWDYSLESPRADLRGFRLDRLAVDPEDAKYDRPSPSAKSDQDIRSDQVLPNGARFYNDHGHPEYATPECWSLSELAAHDAAGELVVWEAAQALARTEGRRVQVFKNNTDFHGASYGSHESYCVPRSLGFEGLYAAVMPMLVARQVVTAAGKAGAESGAPCPFQISQRADFFVEGANAETLYRRPVFNTRDEPHADPREFIRLHVISGDANMMPGCTARKAGLVKLAIMLAKAGEAPVWRISSPPQAFASVSRSPFAEGRIDLDGGSWTTARSVLESYLDAAEAVFDLEPELISLVDDCRELLDLRQTRFEAFARRVDWAAKWTVLDQFRDAEGMAWTDRRLQSLDLAYCSLDREEGLYWGMVEAGMVEAPPDESDLRMRLGELCEPTRAFARSCAVKRLSGSIERVSWSSITFLADGQRREVHLPPDRMYTEALSGVNSVEEFIELLGLPASP